MSFVLSGEPKSIISFFIVVEHEKMIIPVVMFKMLQSYPPEGLHDR